MQSASGDDADTQRQPTQMTTAEAHPLQSTRLPDEVRVNETADTGGEGRGEGEGEGAAHRAPTADAEMTETQAETQPGEEATTQPQSQLESQMALPTQLQVDTGEQAQTSQTQPMPTMAAGEAEKQQQREGHPGAATPREFVAGEAPPSTRAEGAQEAPKSSLSQQEHAQSETKKEGQAGAEPGSAAASAGGGGGGQLRTAVGQPTVVPWIDTRTLGQLHSHGMTRLSCARTLPSQPHG